MVNQGEVNDVFFEDTTDVDAPGLESYNGRCINVNQQGEGQVSHLSNVQQIDEENYPLDLSAGRQLDGPQHDRRQVNDWNMFKGGTGHGEAKKKSKRGKKSYRC